jgi:ABC-type branched-subunit amino acid transport system substrate-binding protein
MSATLDPGTAFGAYRVDEVIGRGGMGVVYRAYDESLERPVALKLVASELADDERFRRRFLREPKLAAGLDHPNVIPIYAAGEQDGRLFLAMRYVAGCDLRTVLGDAGTLAPQRALDILGQVAAALDAAHRRDLVHRDVKPANVLLDAGDHAYLTDFGVTKRVGADTTEAEGIVGTLDYLAPEQIRGGSTDGRADEYALACMLYECLSGTAPFWRATQAETMWAHLNDQPPPLSSPLDPVLRRGLAKEPEDRYGSCGELIAAARAALEPRGAVVRHPPRRRRWAAAAAAVGVVALAAAMIAVLTMTGGSAPAAAPRGSGLAMLDAAGGHVRSIIKSAANASNVAVGEGAVWVLSSQDATVTKIDPRTQAVLGRFTAPAVPTAIAAGGGAVWLGNSSNFGSNHGKPRASVWRVEPRTLKITHTARLPNPGQGDGLWDLGLTQLVVGDGAVWARDPDGSVARIDPGSGRVVARVPGDVNRLAAGDAGVWAEVGNAVARIDPATNRLQRRIVTPAWNAAGIAVGAGAVWVTGDAEGKLWRIDPETRSITTIDVGAGALYVGYGAGAVWTASLLAGQVARVDARTNQVTARLTVPAPQGLAAGAGAVWLSTGGAPAAGTLQAAACGQIDSGGAGRSDVLIASDLPLQGPDSADPRASADAIRLVLRRHGYRAGRFTVGYQSCDESTAQTGHIDLRRCAANADAYAHDDQLVTLIGPFSSWCAELAMATLNSAPGGPIPVIAPTATYAGLTRPTSDPLAEGGYLGEPGIYYPAGVRNFVRLATVDDLAGTALAVRARQLKLRSVYVLLQRDTAWKAQLSEPFLRAARALRVPVAGQETYSARQGYAPLARRIAASGADGVVIAGDAGLGSRALLTALRSRLGPRATLMSGYGYDPAFATAAAGSAAHGLYVATTDAQRAAAPRTAAARSFTADTGQDAQPQYGVLESAQAAEIVLAAIARSDGTRRSVLEQLKASRVKDGIFGTFHFDANGDIDPATMMILRVTGRAGPIRDAAVDRIITIPERLRGG